MNNMRLCHVFEEDYDTLEEVVVYQFGRMYELDSELANIYAFSKTYTNNSYENTNFNMKPIFYGTKTEILIQEKIMLIRYFVEHQQLPPGNKRFH